jgi:hypothetical protein
MAVLSDLQDFVGKLIHLPGNLLTTVADVFPSDKSHSDFDTYCTSKGGKVVTGADGSKSCQMGISVSQDQHGQMLQAMPAQQRFEDMSLDEKHDILKTQLAKQGEYPEEPSPSSIGDDMFSRFMKGGY